MFDEKRLGIQAEPFVMGASEMIQKYLNRKGMGKRRKNIPVTFSTAWIPEADAVLTVTKKCHPQKWFGKYGTETFRSNFGADHVQRSVPLYEEDTSAPATSAYYQDQEGDECWLCPAQLKFFGQVAEIIHVRFG